MTGGQPQSQPDALRLEEGVFAQDDPAAIARSLKASALASRSGGAAPFRSAMSMLTVYIHRAGDRLSDRRRRILERARAELRRAFDRP